MNTDSFGNIFSSIGDMPVVDKSKYLAWGNQMDTAIGQGFYPSEVRNDGTTVYRNTYFASFNNVVIPNQKDYGHIAFIGNRNQQFDIVIRDKDGNIQHTIAKGVSPATVQQYITSANSNVAKRNNSIVSGTNSDKQNGLVASK